jgi:DNA helicase-2/ATP-dependent DNA helicase PcrA
VVTEQNSDGKSFDGVAVLYRSHYQSMQMQMEFQRRGIPFEVRSGLKFFEQAHVKDILSYLKMMVNPFDEISWKRVLKLIPGIGGITAGKLWEHVRATESPVDAVFDASRLVPKKSKDGFTLFLDILSNLREEKYYSSPSAAVDYVLRHGYEDHLYSNYPNAEMRIEDIEQMARFALRYDSLETFLSDMALQGVTDADNEDVERLQGRVVLSTIHQAKGLEWDVVFIIGMNDGRFPSAKSLKNDDEEEERRLFYVGATRAKGTLYLCYPVSAEGWNANGFLRPSRFLRELPKDCFEEIVVEERNNDYNRG